MIPRCVTIHQQCQSGDLTCEAQNDLATALRNFRAWIIHHSVDLTCMAPSVNRSQLMVSPSFIRFDTVYPRSFRM